ncbi:MAG: DUF4132 domain-containing protein [Anaerolineales bacterium]|nr:DUF4132 domain-containing protein [Anaerolineales bacterium]
MLPGEVARERLTAFYIKNWEERQQARVKRLPRKLRRIAGAILDYRHCTRFNTGADRSKREENFRLGLDQLEKLNTRDRQRIFEAFFPQLGQNVEYAWQLLQRLPYQQGYQRKAFRAPNTPRATIGTRGAWLLQMLYSTSGYEQDISWYAAWIPYLSFGAAHLFGILFAAAIDQGGKVGADVLQILLTTSRGEHEIGMMGHHVCQGLLAASNPEGWTAMEQLLLAAQRQEGVRQMIVETIDMAHPEAFRRMLRLISEQKLARFSSVIRAVDVWFGVQWEAQQQRHIYTIIEQISQFLDDPYARNHALQHQEPQTVYLALWAMGFEDAVAAIQPAAQLLTTEQVERRFVATHFLGQLGLKISVRALLPAFKDRDLRIGIHALNSLPNYPNNNLDGLNLFDQLEKLIHRIPAKKQLLAPIVWPWLKVEADRQVAARALLIYLGPRSPKQLIPHLSSMSPYDRAGVVEKLAKLSITDKEVRDTLFFMVGDASHQVREKALKALEKHQASPEDIQILEGYLLRKSSDLRRGVLSILLNQKDEAVLDSVERLLAGSRVEQRLAGLELLRLMIDKDRQLGHCRTRAVKVKTQASALTKAEMNMLDVILKKETKALSLEDALGLMNPAERTPARLGPLITQRLTTNNKGPLITPAAIASLKALDDLIHEKRAMPIIYESWEGPKEELLGNIQYRFPQPKPELSLEENLNRWSLREMWEQWQHSRPEECRDSDGMELVRALAALGAKHGWYNSNPSWLEDVLGTLFSNNIFKLRYQGVIHGILDWFLYLNSTEDSIDLILDGIGKTLKLIPRPELLKLFEEFGNWRTNRQLFSWLNIARRVRDLSPKVWEDRHHIRLWQQLRWLDEPTSSSSRLRPEIIEVINAYNAGGATKADILDHLMGPHTKSGYWRTAFSSLNELSGSKPHPLMETCPILQSLVSQCRERILEIELIRGEMPTAASNPALALRYSGGTDTLIKILKALGRGKLVRGWIYDNISKECVFSHLIRVSGPLPSDSPDSFSEAATKAGITPKRLLELAVYAPQWAKLVEHAVEWPGLEEAVWWIHAHSKGDRWEVAQEIRELWNAQVREYTSLTSDELVDGAVDVGWFSRIYNILGQERWEQIINNAKFASGGGGHTRAQLFAQAMLGLVDKEAVIERIIEKRHQDSVRALGLCPIEKGEHREMDLLNRYRVFKDFLRNSKNFGSQRQTSEKLATRIGMENLARTAGYPDPIRLEWAMEAQETAGLVGECSNIVIGDVQIALTIDTLGQAQVQVSRNDRKLKSIPAKLRKEPAVVELKNNRTELRRQVSRMRRSLEETMVRGDTFEPPELVNLMAHPVLAPMLEQLVFINNDIIGFPSGKGTVLINYDGNPVPLNERHKIKIAHPFDLYAGGEWHIWQKACFHMDRKQPFKQVFRELYLLTQIEKDKGNLSTRYAGHQVNPRQALALLGKRGWVNYPEEGIRRTFHDFGISAWLSFLGGYFTPAEVEGLTLEEIRFTRRGEWKPLDLVDIPPRIFSEVMRDLDLIVSVAHMGGVDPEASESTIEMRASLIRETCAMLGITNVTLQGKRALIEGELSSYSVHLGSSVVHRQPGGAICIVPVHSQHRGRLFLPFVDDDPRTAETLSKVLLLARDKKIKDPVILEQIIAKPA